jgi:hypothetical protein
MAIEAVKNPNKYTLKNTEQYSSRLDVTMEIHDMVGDGADNVVEITTNLNVVLFYVINQISSEGGEFLSPEIVGNIVPVTTLVEGIPVRKITINLGSSPEDDTVRIVLFGLSY